MLQWNNNNNNNIKKVAVQSNEELTSTEQQTEDWNVQDKYVQATSQYLTDCGAGEPSLPWLKKDVDYFTSASKLTPENQLNSVNMKSLKSFLKRTSNVCRKKNLNKYIIKTFFFRYKCILKYVFNNSLIIFTIFIIYI